MPFLVESNEWRLLDALGRLISQRKAPHDVQPGPLDNRKWVHPNAELVEVELRNTFMVRECARNLSPAEFKLCQAKLIGICTLLDSLASERTPHSGSEASGYPHLRNTVAFLEASSEVVDLANGLNKKLFTLPSEPDKLSRCLRDITDCNNTINRVITPLEQEPLINPIPNHQKNIWKKARIRNRATSVLGAVFEHFRCQTPHEVLLKLIEGPDGNSVLPSLQLMLSACQKFDLWQEAQCGYLNSHERSIASISDICTHLKEYTAQAKSLILYVEHYGLFGSWVDSFSSATSSPKESLDQLILHGAFEPLSRNINASLHGKSPAKFSTKDKRALAVKLGFCLMDFFDADLTPKRIYFLDSSNSKATGEFPYLAFSSKLPARSEPYNFQMGHPVLLSFAKLLLEIDCGQPIDLAISPDHSQNHGAWVKLLDVVGALLKDRPDFYLEAIRGCLLVHHSIADALGCRDLKPKDADSKIRKKLYKEVVHKLECGLEECTTKSIRKRPRSESPPPSNPWSRAHSVTSQKSAKLSMDLKAPGFQTLCSLTPQLGPNSIVPKLGFGIASSLLKEQSVGPSAMAQRLLEECAASVTSRPGGRKDFEIAIVCALPLEFNAVSLLVDQFWDENGDLYGRAVGDPNMYTTGRIGKFNVVLALLSNMGKASAASSAASLRSSYPGLRLVLLTGVCGGVPNVGTEDELLLGDVVISKAVVQYDHGRNFPDGFSMKDVLGKPTKNISGLISMVETDLGRERLEQRAAFFLQQLQEKSSRSRRRTNYHYPGTNNDRLFEATFRHKHHVSPQCLCACCHAGSDPVCEESRTLSCEVLGCNTKGGVWRGRLEDKRKLERDGRIQDAEAPFIFVGRFGSGDMVLKSGEDRDRIAKQHDILAFEMEGAGVWDEIPCIVVKGVCDYADSHKDKSWQPFAAATAASVTKALLERYTQTDNPLDSIADDNRSYIPYPYQSK